MAKDNKEDRKSTRSFDLNKGGNRSFELDKKSTRSFNLQKGDEEAIVDAGENAAQQIAGTQPTKEPASSQTAGQQQTPNKATSDQPTQTPKGQTQETIPNATDDGGSIGDDNNSRNGKKWIGAAVIVAAIAVAIWAFSGIGGKSAEESTEEPKTTLVSDSTSNKESNAADSTSAKNPETTAAGASSNATSTASDVGASEGQKPTNNTVQSVETEMPESGKTNVETTTSSNSISTVSGSVEELAKEVLTGKYGNWPDRERNLGNRYKEVQRVVNQMYRTGKVK